MTTAAVVVAVGFGFLLGWALRVSPYPRLPTRTAFVVGMAAGAVILASSYGSSPELAGGSLLLGCAVALAASFIPRRE